LTFAQSEASTKFDAIPRSAVRAGFVDAALRRARSHTDNKIDGAVITLVDLEGKKESYARQPPHRTKQVFSHE